MQKVIDLGDPISDDFLEPFEEAIAKELCIVEKRCEADTPMGKKVWHEPDLQTANVSLDVSDCDWLPVVVIGICDLPSCWCDWIAYLEKLERRIATYSIDINQRG